MFLKNFERESTKTSNVAKKKKNLKKFLNFNLQLYTFWNKRNDTLTNLFSILKYFEFVLYLKIVRISIVNFEKNQKFWKLK